MSEEKRPPPELQRKRIENYTREIPRATCARRKMVSERIRSLIDGMAGLVWRQHDE